MEKEMKSNGEQSVVLHASVMPLYFTCIFPSADIEMTLCLFAAFAGCSSLVLLAMLLSGSLPAGALATVSTSLMIDTSLFFSVEESNILFTGPFSSVCKNGLQNFPIIKL